MEDRYAAVKKRLITAAEKTAAEMYAEFDRLKAEDPAAIMDPERSFLWRDNLGPDGGPHDHGRLKYVLDPKKHIRRHYRYLPYLTDLKGAKAFEIGVGVGYLFALMEGMLEARMSGCDVHVEERRVFREMREHLGIHDRVIEHEVAAGRDIPLPEGTEGVVSIWTGFNNEWGLDEHKWFIDHLRGKLVGERIVAIRFNSAGYDGAPGVRDYFHGIGHYPLPADDARFCVMRL